MQKKRQSVLNTSASSQNKLTRLDAALAVRLFYIVFRKTRRRVWLPSAVPEEVKNTFHTWTFTTPPLGQETKRKADHLLPLQKL